MSWYARKAFLRPVYRHRGINYYSTFQVWELALLLRRRRAELRRFGHKSSFEKLLRLLIDVQDFYLPVIRGDRRMGEVREYSGGVVAYAASYWVTRTTYQVAYLTACRQRCIAEGRYDPKGSLAKAGLTPAEARRWIGTLLANAVGGDPLAEWRLLVSYVDYGMRQKLKYEALLAQDLYEMAEIVRLLLRDAKENSVCADYTEWPDHTGGPVDAVSTWRAKIYGNSHLDRPYHVLELLTNEFHVNPKPRAVILTEGEEWTAIQRIFELRGYDTHRLGIEFRSLQGIGNFSLERWQSFVEYMHERQVLIYFVLDNEGRASSEARKMLTRKRIFRFRHLKRIIPARDRIRIWRSSFEQANFTPAEIARALKRQGCVVTSQDVRASIRSRPKKKGLIEHLGQEKHLTFVKTRLMLDLVDGLAACRSAHPRVKIMRPVERFVEHVGPLVIRNHQPSSEKGRTLNLKSGYLG